MIRTGNVPPAPGAIITCSAIAAADQPPTSSSATRSRNMLFIGSSPVGKHRRATLNLRAAQRNFSEVQAILPRIVAAVPVAPAALIAAIAHDIAVAQVRPLYSAK